LIALDEIRDANPNLQNSIEAEQNDIVEYRRYASAARSEGLETVANKFEQLVKEEKRHVVLFSKVSERMQGLRPGDQLELIGLREVRTG
jgi:rubrerythrin